MFLSSPDAYVRDLASSYCANARSLWQAHSAHDARQKTRTDCDVERAPIQLHPPVRPSRSERCQRRPAVPVHERGRCSNPYLSVHQHFRQRQVRGHRQQSAKRPEHEQCMCTCWYEQRIDNRNPGRRVNSGRIPLLGRVGIYSRYGCRTKRQQRVRGSQLLRRVCIWRY